jgi:hypothetical protein
MVFSLMPDRNLMTLSGLAMGPFGNVVMSTGEDRNIAKANECEIKAKEAIDFSVRRYFSKLARDYRNLALRARLRSFRPARHRDAA